MYKTSCYSRQTDMVQVTILSHRDDLSELLLLTFWHSVNVVIHQIPISFVVRKQTKQYKKTHASFSLTRVSFSPLSPHTYNNTYEPVKFGILWFLRSVSDENSTVLMSCSSQVIKIIKWLSSLYAAADRQTLKTI